MVAVIGQALGIDNDQNSMRGKAKQNVQYSISLRGREGELNYCFTLKNISAGDQQKFISDLKSRITKRDLAYFYENHPCSK